MTANVIRHGRGKKSHPFTVKRRLCIKNTLKLKLEGMKLTRK